ncbi:MAG: two-component system response regulator [Spirochaetia bacterium]|jgi:putative two-component system response regulator
MPETNHNGRKQTILIVDDAPDNLALMSSLLNAKYKTKVATGGAKALEVAALAPPDLILLDVMMPGIDGYEVCRRLKENPKTADVPVIFLTARSDAADEQKGLELGAVDYIAKPISPAIVSTRVSTHLQLKSARDFLQDKSKFLEQEVRRRTHELNTIQDVTMVAMGSLAETRDNETGNHIRRTQNYVKLLAVRLKDHPRFSAFLIPDTIELLYKSAPLHDIGKVGIPDRILLKPEKLTAEEFEIMKTHTTLGRNSIMAAEKLIESPNSFLQLAREIAWSHHEKWDGTGYPQGLSGDTIMIPGRLMAVVDVYDALVSKRVYKPAFPHSTAVSMIKEGSRRHFDPDIVDAFLDTSDQIREVAERFLDAEAG